MQTEQENKKVTFSGNFFESSKLEYLYCILTFLLLAFMLLGISEAGIHSYIFLFVATTVLYLVSSIFYRSNSFTLDDQKGEIAKDKWSIPYEKVEKIYITETHKLLHIKIRKSIWIRS